MPRLWFEAWREIRSKGIKMSRTIISRSDLNRSEIARVVIFGIICVLVEREL